MHDKRIKDQQNLSYDFFYKHANNLTNKQVQSFLISAKIPRSTTLNKFSMQAGQFQGVYFSELPLLQHVILIVLNELSDEPHNAWIKCFASQNKEKQKAFALLQAHGLKLASVQLEWFLSGLWEYWFTKKQENTRRNELTSEEILEMGKFWGESYLSLLKVKDILPYFKPQEILEEFNPAQRQEILKLLTPAE